MVASRHDRVVAILLLFLIVFCPGLLSAQEFLAKDLAILFPGAGAGLRADRVSGSPPAARVTAGGRVIGYAFSTRAVSGSVGFSGKPLDIHIGLTLAGRIAGTRLAAHKEPILVIGISSEDLQAFVTGFSGLDIRRSSALRAKGKPGEGWPDHVTGATVSSTVMRDAILRSARAVAYARGILDGGGGHARIDRTTFTPASWNDLVAKGAITRRTITMGEAATARGLDENDPGALFVEMFTALITPPAIGQNLLGRRAYEQLMAETGPQDNAILIAANGLYSVKGTAWRQSGVFDRLQIVQGGKTIRLRRDDHRIVQQLAARGAPEFREIGVFRIAAGTGFDAARPWRIELLVTSEGKDTAPASFTLEYRIPAAYILQTPQSGKSGTAVKPEPPLWQHLWRERVAEVIGLGLMLTALTVILFGQDWLARRRQLYRRVRIGFLTLTFLFLGLYSGAQLSVVNVVTFTHALLGGFKWDLFLLDPLVFILWSFVALAMLFWGRGVFCGWLCPFGALQELLNEAARKLGVRQIEVPWGLHERLWTIKYAAFLLILGISLQSVIWAYKIAEIEPFKTVIILTFLRSWPYLLYALALLAAGLFIDRFFCRYLCPLGAAIAIPARLKLFEWLKRRPQCGRECRICNTTCTVQAINPLGQISPNECIYCLQCQANYHDATTCLPLKARAQRRAGPGAQETTGGKNAG